MCLCNVQIHYIASSRDIKHPNGTVVNGSLFHGLDSMLEKMEELGVDVMLYPHGAYVEHVVGYCSSILRYLTDYFGQVSRG